MIAAAMPQWRITRRTIPSSVFLEAIFAPLASMEKVFKAVYYVTAHNNKSSKNNNKQKLAATKEKSISAAAKKIYF